MGELLYEIKELEKSLIKIFKMSNLGDSKIYFEINIDCNQSQRTYYFSQSNYIKKIINKYNYNDFKVRKILIKVDLRFVKFKKQIINAKIRNYEIRVNALNSLICQIRPDILNAISTVNQHNINSDQSHWNALEDIFIYLFKNHPIEASPSERAIAN
jgi:hypothetical protein